MNSKTETFNNWKDSFLGIRSIGKSFLVRGLELILLSTIILVVNFYYKDLNFSAVLAIGILAVTLISFLVYKSLTKETPQLKKSRSVPFVEVERPSKSPVFSLWWKIIYGSFNNIAVSLRTLISTLLLVIPAYIVIELLYKFSGIIGESSFYFSAVKLFLLSVLSIHLIFEVVLTVVKGLLVSYRDLLRDLREK